MDLGSYDYSPCEICAHNICHRVYPPTQWEPEERDEECDAWMSSYGSDEGCYKFEEILED